MTRATDKGFIEGGWYKTTGTKGSTEYPIGTLLRFSNDDGSDCPVFEDYSGIHKYQDLSDMSNIRHNEDGTLYETLITTEKKHIQFSIEVNDATTEISIGRVLTSEEIQKILAII